MLGVAFFAGDKRCSQSVLDLLEIELGFIFRGFAEGDDSDFIVGLRMDNGYSNASQQAERFKSLLTVAKAIVFKRKREAVEDSRGIDEVEPVILEIAGTLPF